MERLASPGSRNAQSPTVCAVGLFVAYFSAFFRAAQRRLSFSKNANLNELLIFWTVPEPDHCQAVKTGRMLM
jgi:hypothetical protein